MQANLDSYEPEEDILEEESEEESDESKEQQLRLRPRPPKASLTHHAIKSELLKMNKQNHRDQELDEQSDSKLSRAARKRKRRREKVLEDRRASGRSEDLDDDLAHFKSMSIARRRSSILPAHSNSHNNNAHYNSSNGFCSKLKCLFWISFLIVFLFFSFCYFLNTPDLSVENVESNSNLDEDLIQDSQVTSSEIYDETRSLLKNLDNYENLNDYETTENYYEQQHQQQFDSQQKQEQQNFFDNFDNLDEPVSQQTEKKFDENVNNNFNEKSNLNNQIENNNLHQNEDENRQNCYLNGELINNVDEEQCNLLKAKQNQENHIENNKDEKFYFF